MNYYALFDPDGRAVVLSENYRDGYTEISREEYERRSDPQIYAQKRAREIDALVVSKIRERYDENEELKMLRLGIADPQNEGFMAYNAWAEECRAWGREEKTKMKEE